MESLHIKDLFFAKVSSMILAALFDAACQNSRGDPLLPVPAGPLKIQEDPTHRRPIKKI